MIKGIIYEKDTAILLMHASNNRAVKLIGKKRNPQSYFEPTVNIDVTTQKINKDVEELNNISTNRT